MSAGLFQEVFCTVPEPSRNVIAGIKQVRRGVLSGQLERVYIAADKDARLTVSLVQICAEHNVPVEKVPSARILGITNGIDVPAIAVGIRKQP